MIDRGRHNVLGVMVNALDYEATVAQVVSAGHARRPLAVSALAVHGVMTGVLATWRVGRRYYEAGGEDASVLLRSPTKRAR